MRLFSARNKSIHYGGPKGSKTPLGKEVATLTHTTSPDLSKGAWHHPVPSPNELPRSVPITANQRNAFMINRFRDGNTVFDLVRNPPKGLSSTHRQTHDLVGTPTDQFLPSSTRNGQRRGITGFFIGSNPPLGPSGIQIESQNTARRSSSHMQKKLFVVYFRGTRKTPNRLGGVFLGKQISPPNLSSIFCIRQKACPIAPSP